MWFQANCVIVHCMKTATNLMTMIYIYLNSSDIELEHNISNETFVLGWNWVEDLAPANGANWRITPDHVTVIFYKRHGHIQPDLGYGGITGNKLFSVKQDQVTEHFAGTGVKSDPCSAFKRLFIAFQKMAQNIDHIAGF